MIRPRAALRIVLALVPLIALASCSNIEAPSSSGKSVTIAQVDGFDDAIAVTALWKHLLEEEGYSVNVQSLDPATTFTGMSRGDVDAYMAAWLPTTHQQYVGPYKDDLTVLDPYYDNDRLVLAVPDFVDAETISDVAQNPAQYDNRIVGIEPGAGMMELLRDDVMPAYNMQRMNLLEGSTPAMLAELQGAVRERESMVAALWTPHWAFAELDIRALKDDKGAWPPADSSHIVVGNEFAEDNTEVVDWFRNTQLNDEQLTSLMAEMQEADSPEAAVDAWLEDHGDVVEGWTD